MLEPNTQPLMLRMLSEIRAHGFKDERVLGAMAQVPRHMFVPDHVPSAYAYADHPIAIGRSQTISQPFIVAHMTKRLHAKPDDCVLEIGTGSGYQAAVLASLGVHVVSVERIPELAQQARRNLDRAGCGDGVDIIIGDGYLGAPEHAPYDGILLTCAPERIPDALLRQLKDGALLVAPEGRGPQELIAITRTGETWQRTHDMWVRFVPMTHGIADA